MRKQTGHHRKRLTKRIPFAGRRRLARPLSDQSPSASRSNPVSCQMQIHPTFERDPSESAAQAHNENRDQHKKTPRVKSDDATRRTDERTRRKDAGRRTHAHTNTQSFKTLSLHSRMLVLLCAHIQRTLFNTGGLLVDRSARKSSSKFSSSTELANEPAPLSESDMSFFVSILFETQNNVRSKQIRKQIILF